MGSFKFIPAVWQGLALALALGGSLPATAQVWSIQNLGNLSGNYTNALGVNIHGEVTGYSYVGNNPHGFRWTLATGMVDLGVLDSGNNPQSAGNAINDSGLVAGFAYAEDNYGNPYTYAVTWTGTTMTVLNDFSGVYPAYRAMAVNASGEIAGFSYVDMVPDTHACTWPGPKDLGTLGGQASFGLGINDAGQVVGTSQFQTGNPVNHAFFYAGSMQDLGVFPGDTYSTAYAINNKGQVVGSSDAAGGYTPPFHAFLWTATTGMKSLGTPPFGDSSRGLAINNSGQVVGAFGTNGGTIHAFLWTPKHGFVDLNSLLPAGSDWVLESANGINDAGQIVGTANGGSRGFILTPVTLKSLKLSPASVVASVQNATGTVTLNWPAPAGGATVALSSDNPAAAVQQNVTVLEGATSAQFPVTTTAVSTKQVAHITATLGPASKVVASLTLLPISVQSVSLTPNPVVGGNTSNGTVTLQGNAAPGDIVVNLSSSNPSIASPSPSQITIPMGSQTGSFSVTTTSVSTTQTVLITATANGASKSKKLSVKP